MTTYKRIKSVDPTLDILEFLSIQKGPVAGKTIAEGVKLPYGTVMGYLATLGDRNYVKTVGEYFELGMPAGMLWSRMKARKEAVKRQAERDLEALETGITGYGGV